MEHVFTDPSSLRWCISGWVNGSDYEPSSESFEILPLSPASRDKLGMLAYHPQFAKDINMCHKHLTQQQGTRIAILPVHTPEERTIFRTLVKERKGEFAKKTQPNWVTVACLWASYCDGKKVFYKVNR